MILMVLKDLLKIICKDARVIICNNKDKLIVYKGEKEYFFPSEELQNYEVISIENAIENTVDSYIFIQINGD